MKLSISVATLSSLLLVFATTADRALSDIQDLALKGNALVDSIKAFKSPNDPKSILGIHYAARGIVDDIRSTTRNIKTAMSKPVPPHHIQDAFSACETLQSAIVTAMNDAVAKKDIVAAIPVPGIASFVRQLILDVKTESQAFQKTVLPGANNTTRPAGLAMVDAVNQAFDDAITAYSI